MSSSDFQKWARTVEDVYGNEGLEFVEALPHLLATCAEQWGLTIGEPFTLSYNYVTRAKGPDGEARVLKLRPSSSIENIREPAALRLVNGDGVIELLRSNSHAMLMECALPGAPLATLVPDKDDTATEAAAQIMMSYWKPPPRQHSFPSTADLFVAFSEHRKRHEGTAGAIDAQLFTRAESLFAGLSHSMSQPVVLHGDLHHENILSATRRPWLAIDPKGVIGDREYELGAFVRSPVDVLMRHPDPRSVVKRRIRLLCELLELDVDRAISWSFAQSILKLIWYIEDHGQAPESAISFAHLAYEIHLRS